MCSRYSGERKVPDLDGIQEGLFYAPVNNDRDAPQCAPVNNVPEPEGPHFGVGPVPSGSLSRVSPQALAHVGLANQKACARGILKGERGVRQVSGGCVERASGHTMSTSRLFVCSAAAGLVCI